MKSATERNLRQAKDVLDIRRRVLQAVIDQGKPSHIAFWRRSVEEQEAEVQRLEAVELSGGRRTRT